MSSGVYSYLWRGIFSQLETPFGIVGILQHFRELMLSGLHHTKLEPSIWEHFSLKRELNNITFWTMWSRSSWSYFKIIIKQVMEHYKTNVLLLDTFIFRYFLHHNLYYFVFWSNTFHQIFVGNNMPYVVNKQTRAYFQVWIHQSEANICFVGPIRLGLLIDW